MTEPCIVWPGVDGRRRPAANWCSYALTSLASCGGHRGRGSGTDGGKVQMHLIPFSLTHLSPSRSSKIRVILDPNPIEAGAGSQSHRNLFFSLPPVLQLVRISIWAYLGAYQRWGVGQTRWGAMAAVPESPVVMAAAGGEPPVEVVPAAAESPVAPAAARLEASRRVVRRRWALCVRFLYPVHIGGPLCGLTRARGATWPSGLTAWPVPFASVPTGASKMVS